MTIKGNILVYYEMQDGFKFCCMKKSYTPFTISSNYQTDIQQTSSKH